MVNITEPLFKVGDLVTIRSDLEPNTSYYNLRNAHTYASASDERLFWAGCEVKISRVMNADSQTYYYKVNDIEGVFVEEMFELYDDYRGEGIVLYKNAENKSENEYYTNVDIEALFAAVCGTT